VTSPNPDLAVGIGALVSHEFATVCAARKGALNIKDVNIQTKNKTKKEAFRMLSHKKCKEGGFFSFFPPNPIGSLLF
jgi:hypothetical protein